MGQKSARTSRSVYSSCESERESAHNPTWRAVQIERSKVVQCDQTSPLATSMMLCSEEVRRPFQRPVSFLPTSEVQRVNHIDRSFGAVFARWRGLGILSLPRLARLQDERRTIRVRGVFYEGSKIETNSRTLFSGSLNQFSPPEVVLSS
jgi:hypothetical protein